MRSWWRVPFVAETVLLEAGLQLLSPMFCQVNDSRLPLAVTRLIEEQRTESMRLRKSRNTPPDICTSSWTLEKVCQCYDTLCCAEHAARQARFTMQHARTSSGSLLTKSQFVADWRPTFRDIRKSYAEFRRWQASPSRRTPRIFRLGGAPGGLPVRLHIMYLWLKIILWKSCNKYNWIHTHVTTSSVTSYLI